jgi:ABC-type nickel/cobalt efflux system permease component RcnA
MAVPVALLAIHLTAVSWGSTLALSLGLAICLGWGAILILSRPRRRAV